LAILVATGSFRARSLALRTEVYRAILARKGTGTDALEGQRLLSGLDRNANGAGRAAVSKSIARIDATTAERTEPTRTADASSVGGQIGVGATADALGSLADGRRRKVQIGDADLISGASKRALRNRALWNANNRAIIRLGSAESNFADATSTGAGQSRANTLGIYGAGDGANRGIGNVRDETAASFGAERSSISAETTRDKLGAGKVTLQDSANRGLWANDSRACRLVGKGWEEAIRSSPTASALSAADGRTIGTDVINEVALADAALDGGCFISIDSCHHSGLSVNADLVGRACSVARNCGRSVAEAIVSRVARWAQALKCGNVRRKVTNTLSEVATARAARLDAKTSICGVVARSAFGAQSTFVSDIARRAHASESECGGGDSNGRRRHANGVGILGTASIHTRSEVRGRSTASRRIRNTITADRARASHWINRIVHVTLRTGANESTGVKLLALTIWAASNGAGRGLIRGEAVSSNGNKAG
jgi:hypothetical protein